MLPLPKSLKIDRDLEEEKDLLAKSRAYLEKSDRTGIHATDLMDPRISYFKKLTGAPIPDRLINMFIVGQIAHSIIEVVKSGTGDYTRPSDVGTKVFNDLHYSPDFLNFKGEPDEIKTTRSFYPPNKAYLPDDDTFHMYLEQLLTYMAAEEKTVGRLTILYLNLKGEDGRTSPQFYVWKVEAEIGAIKAMQKVLGKAKNELEFALGTKDFSALPLCRRWKCGEKECDFWLQCLPVGRFGIPKKEWTA